MRRQSILFAIPAAAVLLGSAVSAGAQEDPNNRTLTPDLCVAEPRAAEDLIATLGLDAASADEAPSSEPAEVSVPLGTQAGREVVEGVEAATRGLFACFNAGDVPRAAGYLTDFGVTRFFGFGPREGEADQILRDRATGVTEPRTEDDYIRLIAVTDVALLPDGRAAAFVVNNEPLLPPRGAETLLFIYSQAEDGTWLIDDYYDFTIVPPVTGTPTS